MTTIKKKSYLPPTVEVVYIDNSLNLLSGSKIDVEFEDDNVDIINQDAPNLDLGTFDLDI
jgi:hypothetical protein